MTDLTEMWAALEAYQPRADKAGHGESWKRMTTERTSEAADAAQQFAEEAADAVWDSGNNAATDLAADAAHMADGAILWAEMNEIKTAKHFTVRAIECIDKAIVIQREKMT